MCVGEREQGETEQPLKGFMCVLLPRHAWLSPCHACGGFGDLLKGKFSLSHARGPEGWHLGQTQASSGKRSYKKITHRGLAHPPKAPQSAGDPWEQKREGDCAIMGG